MKWVSRLAAAIWIVTGGATQALAQGFVPPDWLKQPRPEDLLAVWPKAALKTGKGGSATISCKVSLQGGLFDCIVLSEKPEGRGFGGAALALTPQLLMKPATRDGEPVISSVRIPVNFPEFTVSKGDEVGMLTTTVLSHVTWSRAPTTADVAAAYPAEAREKRLTGHATLDCRFKNGALAGCRTLVEEPKGAGFASAAKSLAKLFAGPTALADGQSTNGMKVQVPFAFSPQMLEAEKPVIGKPDWTGIPDDRAFQAAYPAAALSAGVRSGRIRLNCAVAPKGAVDQCIVLSEEPQGLGFGAAAMSLTPAFRLGIWTDEGLPTVGGRVTIPLRYQFTEAVDGAEIRLSDPARP